MRGKYYLWRDDRLHLWAADGYDGWDESGWAQPRDESNEREASPAEQPSGVAIPQDVADDYVVMRLAELVRDGTVEAVIERALTRHGGNGGALALSDNAPALLRALQSLRITHARSRRDDLETS